MEEKAENGTKRKKEDITDIMDIDPDDEEKPLVVGGVALDDDEEEKPLVIENEEEEDPWDRLMSRRHETTSLGQNTVVTINASNDFATKVKEEEAAKGEEMFRDTIEKVSQFVEEVFDAETATQLAKDLRRHYNNQGLAGELLMDYEDLQLENHDLLLQQRILDTLGVESEPALPPPDVSEDMTLPELNMLQCEAETEQPSVGVESAINDADMADAEDTADADMADGETPLPEGTDDADMPDGEPPLPEGTDDADMPDGEPPLPEGTDDADMPQETPVISLNSTESGQDADMRSDVESTDEPVAAPFESDTSSVSTMEMEETAGTTEEIVSEWVDEEDAREEENHRQAVEEEYRQLIQTQLEKNRALMLQNRELRDQINQSRGRARPGPPSEPDNDPSEHMSDISSDHMSDISSEPIERPSINDNDVEPVERNSGGWSYEPLQNNEMQLTDDIPPDSDEPMHPHQPRLFRYDEEISADAIPEERYHYPAGPRPAFGTRDMVLKTEFDQILERQRKAMEPFNRMLKDMQEQLNEEMDRMAVAFQLRQREDPDGVAHAMRMIRDSLATNFEDAITPDTSKEMFDKLRRRLKQQMKYNLLVLNANIMTPNFAFIRDRHYLLQRGEIEPLKHDDKTSDVHKDILRDEKREKDHAKWVKDTIEGRFVKRQLELERAYYEHCQLSEASYVADMTDKYKELIFDKINNARPDKRLLYPGVRDSDTFNLVLYKRDADGAVIVDPVTKAPIVAEITSITRNDADRLRQQNAVVEAEGGEIPSDYFPLHGEPCYKYFSKQEFNFLGTKCSAKTKKLRPQFLLNNTQGDRMSLYDIREKITGLVGTVGDALLITKPKTSEQSPLEMQMRELLELEALRDSYAHYTRNTLYNYHHVEVVQSEAPTEEDNQLQSMKALLEDVSIGQMMKLIRDKHRYDDYEPPDVPKELSGLRTRRGDGSGDASGGGSDPPEPPPSGQPAANVQQPAASAEQPAWPPTLPLTNQRASVDPSVSVFADVWSVTPPSHGPDIFDSNASSDIFRSNSSNGTAYTQSSASSASSAYTSSSSSDGRPDFSMWATPPPAARRGGSTQSVNSLHDSNTSVSSSNSTESLQSVNNNTTEPAVDISPFVFTEDPARAYADERRHNHLYNPWHHAPRHTGGAA